MRVRAVRGEGGGLCKTQQTFDTECIYVYVHFLYFHMHTYVHRTLEICADCVNLLFEL